MAEWPDPTRPLTVALPLVLTLPLFLTLTPTLNPQALEDQLQELQECAAAVLAAGLGNSGELSQVCLLSFLKGAGA